MLIEENSLMTDNQLNKIKQFSKEKYYEEKAIRTKQREQIFFKKLNDNGIEMPEKEFVFHKKRKWRFDYCFVKLGIAIEIEGAVWQNGRHTRGSGFIKDMEKYNEAAIYGYSLLRSTPNDFYKDSFVNKVVTLVNSKKENRNFAWKFSNNKINPELLQVLEFNDKFNFKYSKKPNINDNLFLSVRQNKFAEEISEYYESVKNKDLAQILHELVDVQYALNGLIVHHGLHSIFNDAFELIHSANMAKELVNKELIKPKGWQKADLSKLL